MPPLGPHTKPHLFPSLLNLQLSFHFPPAAPDLAALSLHCTARLRLLVDIPLDPSIASCSFGIMNGSHDEVEDLSRLSPPWSLGQLSRIQPMSELCLFHRPGHRHPCSHVPTKWRVQVLFETPTHGASSLPIFLLSFPGPWSLSPLFHRRMLCYRKQKVPAGCLAFASKSINL